MSRLLFGVLGVLIALVPRAVIETYEQIVFENPEECTAKPWLEPAVRAEGVVYALAGLVGGRSYGWVMNVAGVAGLLAALAPERYLEAGVSIAYDHSDDVAWNDGVVPAVRVIGVVAVVLTLRAIGQRRRDASAQLEDGSTTD
ncbi:hypothetical protein [Natrarchaeobius chitinivorans]|uniref:DUF4267 domain-containing protein n=1 Tax=Natrarchaeobius chitinivorans TaxID=1679083 RepID=A0A3N6MF66_NATCH|nr:hypothetical protein [Natrarchaeobius chitinivorans]RQG94211.1 hypothetical protein EA473_12615 [Natrarchaeobius chitinivorans]